MDAAGSKNGPRGRLLRLKLGFRILLLSPGSITIGRKQSCDLVLDDPQTSRLHARVIVGEQSAAIQDTSSGNGVFVNGKRIQGLQRLDVGDRIQIGIHTIEVLDQREGSSTGSHDSETTMIGARLSIPADWSDEHEAPTRIKGRDGK